MRRTILLLLGVVVAAACDKVPLVDINAQFLLADTAWYEEEETLFLFYRVNAEQGLGPDNQIELTFRTDTEELPWTPISKLTPVHTHVPVDCGTRSLCGSMSVHVRDVPRQVGLRLRYHPEGAVVLDAPVNHVNVNTGLAWISRSLAVYGVFDETNTLVQWRARHQFPTLRNEQAQELGLRRDFQVADPRHGDVSSLVTPDNVYGYGFAVSCPETMTPLTSAPVQTHERAIFDLTPLPLNASTSPHVCARATVKDARGSWQTTAIAQKNPEVQPAFSALRSPMRTATPLRFLLRPCDQFISEEHQQMQRQRLLLSDAEEICVDDWQDSQFPGQLASLFQSRIDQARAAGNDLVLVLALHHDDRTGGLGTQLEKALEILLPNESDKSTPRLVGAFVFDSFSHTTKNPVVRRLALWCPADPLRGDDLDVLPSASLACALAPDLPNIQLGPFRFGNLPILPTRSQYLNFLDKYSEAQAGRMKAMTFRAPERTAFSENLPVGDFGVATFFNNETISAQPTDAFSFCPTGNPESQSVVFRTTLAPDQPAPLALLPEVHLLAPQPTYSLGVVWDFPFLLRLDYEVVTAGAATAYGFTVPFGIASPAEAYYGSQLWTRGEFPLDKTLLKCTRFCGHPTFDSAGVYNVNLRFNEAYKDQCYLPRYPASGDGGFPLDP